jgi:hypothetical protein
MGDMNAEPHEEPMRCLRGDLEMDGVRGDFRDAWLELHPEPAPSEQKHF